jgi:hypothetical protein
MATLHDDCYRMWVGTETVTYANKPAAGTTTDTVNFALRRSLRRDEIQRFSYQEIAWNIPAAELSGSITPQHRDTITDSAAVVWTILDIEKLDQGKRWRFICRKEK